MQRFNQGLESRRQHDQITAVVRGNVSVGDTCWDENRGARADAFPGSVRKSELDGALEDMPRFVVLMVDVELRRT